MGTLPRRTFGTTIVPAKPGGSHHHAELPQAMKQMRLLTMDWKHLCFCHWRVSPEQLRVFAPPGWEIDTFDGAAWLSVVPFVMENIRAGILPVVPGFHSVLELNLRTYVRRGSDRAVFFFSLDAASALMVQAARFTTGLPYFHAEMHLARPNNAFEYSSRRIHRGAAAGEFHGVYRSLGSPVGAPANSLEFFLHERYHFVTAKNLIGTVFHEPYRLQRAEIDIRTNSLAAVTGIALPPEPDACYYVADLRVRAAYGGLLAQSPLAAEPVAKVLR